MLLMAYGYPGVRLADVVDFIESDDEFREFMYMSREEFQNLLDQRVFDEQVLDTAFSSFMDDKARKANWFKADGDDIFCQIPRQETNLIFPPRSLVIRVVDDLAKECPDCFDDPEAKWFFPNETSGLFVAEVTKRLYLSPVMRRKMSDDRSRLRHILEHQMFVAAPNVVSLRVLESFVFGFNGAESFDRSHFKVLDLSDIDGDDAESTIRNVFGIR
jgi:type II restriction enzyme